MVRARTSRVVSSQRDVRQTTHPHPHPHPHTQPTTLTTHHHTTNTHNTHNTNSTTVSHTVHHRGGGVISAGTYCSWCRAGGEYACLEEASHASCLDSEYLVPAQDWTTSAMNSEGWVPASGPCCEDCLEAAFDPRKAEGSMGREVMEEVHVWCQVRGEQVRVSVRRGWQVLCDWLERAKRRWGPSPTTAQDCKVGGSGWDGVSYEAEGFVEVKVVLSRSGVIQHMEVDLPTHITVHQLKAELATLIDLAADQQEWFYQTQPMDNSKTLDQLHVDIGAIIEVKCRS